MRPNKDTIWFRRYGTDLEDGGYDIAVDTSGNYVVAGLYNFAWESSWGDVWVLKIESDSGDTVWTHNYGDSQGQIGYGIVVDDSNRYVVSGKTYLPGANDNVWVLRLDSQTGGLLWERNYGAGGGERGYSIVQDVDGFYIIAGFTASFGEGGLDAWVVKISPSSGDTVWTHTYGTEDDDKAEDIIVVNDSLYLICGFDASHFTAKEIKSSDGTVSDSMDFSIKRLDMVALDDRGYGIALDSSGFYVITGYSGTYETGEDALIVKYDPQIHDTVWTKLYGGSGNDGCYAVSVDRIGYYVLAGFTESEGAGGKDFWVLKISPLDGDTIWTRHYGGSGDDVAKGIAIDDDNNYIIVGYTKSYGAGGGDLWILKINSQNGDTIWSRIYGGSEFEGGNGVAVDTSGDYVVCGNTWTYDPGNLENVWILKINHETGDTLWTKSYGDEGGQCAFDVIVDRDGNYVISAKTTFHYTDDVWVLKVNPITGDTSWTVHYGTDRNEKGYSIAQDREGYYVVAGFTDKRGTNNPDYYIGKISPDSGKLLFTRRLGGNGVDRAEGVIVDDDSFYVVIGYSNSTYNGDYDVYLVKYNPWDENPPVIDSVTRIEDDHTYPYGPYDVWATIMDSYSGVREAVLHWKTELDTYYRDVIMTGTPYSKFRASIPEIFTTLDSLKLFYYVTAKDGAGNEAVSDTLDFYIITTSHIKEKQNNSDIVVKMPSIVRGNNLKVLISLKEGTEYRVNVFSKDGRRLWSKHDVFIFKESTFLVPEFKRGVYFLEIRTKNKRKIVRFVVI